MEQVNVRFLSALRSALHGEKAELGSLSREEWSDLLHQAEIHKVLPLILEAVYGSASMESLGEGALMLLKRRVRRQVVLQTLRTGEFLALNRKLRDAGVTPLVVKGLICRELYPQPDHRPSSDEDVLIPAEQFALCRDVMLGFGMETVGEATPDAFEIPWRKPDSPLYLELHRQLFAPEAEAYGDWNRFFDGVFHRAVEVEVQGSRVLTMAPTDHLFYLICHALKHFLHGGFGIRQVCDIALFARHYGDEIDWQQVYASCGEIRAEQFAGAIFRIGEKYLGVEFPELWQGMDIDEAPMLEDLLAAGVFGSSSLSRRHSSNITLDAAAAQKQGKKQKNALLASAFPSAEKLAGNYPYLKEKPYLLPLAWGQRLWRYSRETRENRDNTAAEALRIGADRVELMRRYGIIR